MRRRLKETVGRRRVGGTAEGLGNVLDPLLRHRAWRAAALELSSFPPLISNKSPLLFIRAMNPVVKGSPPGSRSSLFYWLAYRMWGLLALSALCMMGVGWGLCFCTFRVGLDVWRTVQPGHGFFSLGWCWRQTDPKGP